VQNISFRGLSLLNHTIYAVSVCEDGGFGITKARLNIEEEEWYSDDEDSAVI
jgi:hypothetical protein